jgi:hypothetical protein
VLIFGCPECDRTLHIIRELEDTHACPAVGGRRRVDRKQPDPGSVPEGLMKPSGAIE